jgi:hypothetical protein
MRKRDFAIDPLTPWEWARATLWRKPTALRLPPAVMAGRLSRYLPTLDLSRCSDGDHSDAGKRMRAVYREN